MVNIIIPGAPKAGTTSIAAILAQHKDIFVPSIKEPRYFIADELKSLKNSDPLKNYLLSSSVLDWEKYKKVYASTKKYQIDASVQYLFYHQTVIPKIKEKLGDPIIIIILRDPIKRGLSNFVFNKKSEKSLSLVDAIKDEINNNRSHLNSFYHYYKQSLYFDAVKEFQDNFSKVLVLFYEDFVADNLKFINSILKFLELRLFDKLPDLPKLNTSSELTLLGKLLIGKYSFFGIACKYLLPFFYNKGQIFQYKLKLNAKYSKELKTKAILKDEDLKFLKTLFSNDQQKIRELLDKSN